MSIRDKYRALTKIELDFTLGTFQDQSPNAITVTPTITTGQWQTSRYGRHYCIGPGVFNAGDNADFDYNQPQSFIIAIKTTDTSGTLCSKSDGAAAYKGWNIYITSGYPLFRIYETGSADGIRATAAGAGAYVSDGMFHIVHVTYDGSGTAAGIKFYVDGAAVTSTPQLNTGIASSTLNTANWTCASVSYGGGTYEGCLFYISQISAELSVAEVAQSYSELMARPKWNLKNIKNLKSPDGTVQPGFIDFVGKGWDESVANITSGYVDNSGFLRKNGTFKVTQDVGFDKYLYCVSQGEASFYSEVAYGKWRFTFNKPDNMTMKFYFISNQSTLTGANGYYVQINGNEGLNVVCQTGGGTMTKFSSANSIFAHNTDITIEVERVVGNNFYVYQYVNGVRTLLTAATGANPFNDATYTSSSYVVAFMDTDVKIKGVSILGA